MKIAPDPFTHRNPDVPDRYTTDMAIGKRSAAKRQTAILIDWKDRFIPGCDVELHGFISAAARDTAASPSSRDGSAAAISADACVAAQGKPGTIVSISMPARPALHA